jgi:hypothetical protein
MHYSKPFLNSILAIILLVSLSLAHADSSKVIFTPRIELKGEAGKYLKGIEITNSDGQPSDTATTIDFEADDEIQINFGLSESILKNIILIPYPGTKFKFRIERQYETSLSIMDEGPHMDLLNWKHHVSDWQSLEETGALSYALKDSASEEFPSVSKQEIIEAVEAESRSWATKGYSDVDRWVKLAKECTNATAYPCGVSISTVRLRVQVMENKNWKNIQIIEFIIPMGC